MDFYFIGKFQELPYRIKPSIKKEGDNMKKKQILSMITAITILALTGCQKSPESSIVTNKDFDKMVDLAENSESGTSEVSGVAKDFDVYQTTISDESLGVTVNVDAKVDIPKTNQMSVIRIRQREITQEFLDKVIEELTPEVELFDGSIDLPRSKDAIEEEIQMYKDAIKSIEAEAAQGVYDEETVEIYREEYQGHIDELQEEYESAPETVPLRTVKSDGRFHGVAEGLEENPKSDFYNWQHSMTPTASVFYGVSDESNGAYHSLYAQNNEDYGNGLIYQKSSSGQLGRVSVMVDSPVLSGEVWAPSGEPLVVIEDGELRESEAEPLTISQEEARVQADELLTALGLTEYGYYDSGVYCQEFYYTEEALEYRKIHVIRYFRDIDGAFANNEGGMKLTDEWAGDEYNKKAWPGENVLVYVNDTGIVGFYYLAPLEPMETVVDKASMKPFEEIQEIFEQMIVVTNAREQLKTTLKVDRVSLRYTRISEADSFDTGLLVPVWEFEGTYEGEAKMSDQRRVLLTINAIDGSVIDPDIGY